jgi:MFS family permease
MDPSITRLQWRCRIPYILSRSVKAIINNIFQISAAIVGLATGLLLWAPLSQYIGRSSCIFWDMLGALAMCIWSATMTGSGDYIPFVISRWLSGTFGSAPSTIGAGTVLDIFFLHQLGKAFVCYTLFTLFGTQFGPTVGGFIVEKAPWPTQFYWTIGVEGFVVIFVFFFLQETRFPRGHVSTPPSPE